MNKSKGLGRRRVLQLGFGAAGAADLQRGWYRPPHIHFMVSATGLRQFVTQSYFRGEEIADNDFIQQLNQRDSLLQSPRLTPEEREALIIDFTREGESEGLVGKFDIQI